MTLTSVVLAAAAAIEERPLPVPSVVFPIIAIGVFAVLAAVAWSYRDVAHRHSGGKADHGTPQGH